MHVQTMVWYKNWKFWTLWCLQALSAFLVIYLFGKSLFTNIFESAGVPYTTFDIVYVILTGFIIIWLIQLAAIHLYREAGAKVWIALVLGSYVRGLGLAIGGAWYLVKHQTQGLSRGRKVVATALLSTALFLVIDMIMKMFYNVFISILFLIR